MQLFVDFYGFFDLVLRGCLLATQALVVGGVSFLAFVVYPLSATLGAETDQLIRRCLRVLYWSALALVVGELVSAGVLTAMLMGTLQVAISDAVSANAVLISLVSAILAGALALIARDSGVYWKWRFFAIELALLIVVAHIGLTHAVSRTEIDATLIASEIVHVLASSMWIGGIPYFLVALTMSKGGDLRRPVARRFSMLSVGAVAALVVGGVLMALQYTGSFEALFETNYGVLISTKVLLLLGLLCLGAANFFTVRRLQREPASETKTMSRFAEVEVGVGLAVLLCAAALASSSLPTDALTEHTSWNEISERFAPHWPRFKSPQYAELSAAQAAGQQSDAAVDATPEPSAEAKAADIAWAEINHHFAGAIVLLMGVFALLQHNRRAAPYARHWPLLFLVLAAFLLMRADEVAWPLGRIGFWQSLRDPQIAQHKLIIALIAAFAIFEWRVRLNQFKSAWPSFIFPLTTGAAAAFLLTHYGHTDGKGEVLIEISHTPIALLGITAAGARWLEIRLDDQPAGRIAGLVWPVTFILSGILLMLYREA